MLLTGAKLSRKLATGKMWFTKPHKKARKTGLMSFENRLVSSIGLKFSGNSN